jgi:hypothetical protein
MAIVNPLRPEEVAECYHFLFDFAKQWQENVPSKTRPNKKRTLVSVQCSLCHGWRGVPVNDVRNWVAGRRSQMPGTHRKCKYIGQHITAEGYVWLWMPEHPHAYDGKYVPEHIAVMEKSLGRYLDRKAESVHHIDGDKTNNNITNLQLRKKFHGKGQKWECGDCGSHNILSLEL